MRWISRARMRPLPARLALALTALVSSLCGAAAPAAAAPVGDCVVQDGWGSPRADLTDRVVALVNAHRTRLGLRSLAVSRTLGDAAMWKARHMGGLGYFSHADPAPPVDRTPENRMQACGYPQDAGTGENIARGQTSAEDVMRNWLASPGHRENIERAAFAAIGVGVASGRDGRLLWVQNFGTVADGGPAASAALAAPAAAAPAALTAPAPAAAPAAAPDPEPVAAAAPADAAVEAADAAVAAVAAPAGTPLDTQPTASAAPAQAALGVACARSARARMTCSVAVPAGTRGATIRARLMRGSRTVAKGRTRVRRGKRAGEVRLKLARRVRPGRYALRVQVTPRGARRPVTVRRVVVV